MSSGTKVVLAVLGLLMGGLVLYYTAVSGDRGGLEVEKPAAPPSGPLAKEKPVVPSVSGERPAQREAAPAQRETAAAPERSTRQGASSVGPLTESIDRASEAGRAPVSPLSGRTGGAGTPPPVVPAASAPRRAADSDAPTRPPSGADAARASEAMKAVLTATGHLPSSSSAAPASSAPAPAPAVQPRPASKEYVVEPGDTMSSIAQSWLGDSGKWDLVAKANPLVDPNTLRPGDRLRLPPRDAQREPIAVPPAPAAGTAAPGTYTVRSGDSLSAIARAHYGTSARWRDIYDANKAAIGADPHRLKVGMTLVIPRR